MDDSRNCMGSVSIVINGNAILQNKEFIISITVLFCLDRNSLRNKFDNFKFTTYYRILGGV